jgi:hypothetical protein
MADLWALATAKVPLAWAAARSWLGRGDYRSAMAHHARALHSIDLLRSHRGRSDRRSEASSRNRCRVAVYAIGRVWLKWWVFDALAY